MTPTAQEFAEKLDSADPVDRLREEEGRRMISEGWSREAVMGALEDLREALSEDQQLNAEDAVLVVMDHMVGWCNPLWSLANEGFSESDEDPDDQAEHEDDEDDEDDLEPDG